MELDVSKSHSLDTIQENPAIQDPQPEVPKPKYYFLPVNSHVGLNLQPKKQRSDMLALKLKHVTPKKAQGSNNRSNEPL